MAEDEGGNQDLDAGTEEERSRPGTNASKKRETKRQKSQNRSRSEPKKPKCRSRIDQLAIPSRRLILALYQEHAEHLSKEKREKIKVLLQELYAMTPEETEKYFADLKKKSDEIARQKDVKYMLKVLVKKKKKEKQYREAYEFIKKILVDGMTYATKNSIPPLVSVRLRNLSNIILEQICDLRNVNIPNRDDQHQVGSFFIAVADWMAIAIEHLYYSVQLKKNKELEIIEKEVKEKEKLKSDKEKKERGNKDKLNDDDAQEGEDEDKDEAVISEPLMVSDIEE